MVAHKKEEGASTMISVDALSRKWQRPALPLVAVHYYACYYGMYMAYYASSKSLLFASTNK